MSVQGQELIDRARTLSLPAEWMACAAQNRGMPRGIFADRKIDWQLIPSGHFLPQENQ